ncbi:MAG: hypothetical protein ACXVHU_03510 [Methanobacterium sp.]
MTPKPATVVIAAPTTTQTVGMQKTGIPVNILILAFLMVFGGLFGVKKR